MEERRRRNEDIPSSCHIGEASKTTCVSLLRLRILC